MQTDYARQYEDLWRRHWWWRARERFVEAHLRRLARDPARGTRHILDVGCGNGLFFNALQKFGEVRGIEPDAGLVTDGPHRARIDVQPFDATFTPAEAFDWVLMLDVLEHIEDDAAAVRHVHDILAPGGVFLLTVPALMVLWSRHDVANHHYRRYTRRSLREVLTGAGFAVQSVRYFFGWTTVPMVLRRILAPGKPEPSAGATYQVRVPPALVNGLMYGKSRAEQFLTANGRWGLPIGSSLIAIARKGTGVALPRR